MSREGGIRQREIVGCRLAFADAELITKYTLPFVDATWRTAFFVLDLLGNPPKILEGPVRVEGPRLRTTKRRSDLRPIESVSLDSFAALVHFDPWWAFRGVSGVDRAWIQAILATNIAHPFRREARTFKIHDLVFSDRLDRLDALIAKDEVFRTVSFHAGGIDLLALRSKPAAHESRMMQPAKAL